MVLEGQNNIAILALKMISKEACLHQEKLSKYAS